MKQVCMQWGQVVYVWEQTTSNAAHQLWGHAAPHQTVVHACSRTYVHGHVRVRSVSGVLVLNRGRYSVLVERLVVCARGKECQWATACVCGHVAPGGECPGGKYVAGVGRGVGRCAGGPIGSKGAW